MEVDNPRETAKADFGALEVEIEFAKKLAGNEKMHRDRAMRNLWRWFRSQSESGKKFSQKELMVLWKGLYYCMWMSDKPKIQEELADKIVSFITCFESEPTNLFRFLDAYFQTMTREYFRIDRFRIDKFLMLLRRMFHGSLRWIRTQQWNEEYLIKFFTMLRQHVLCGDNAVCSEGLQNFMTEICLVELNKVLEEEENASHLSDATPLCIVFCDILHSAKTPFLRRAMMKNLLEDAKKYPALLRLLRFDDVATYAVDKGKDASCPSKSRSALYEVRNIMQRLQKLVTESPMEADTESPE